MTTRRIDEIVFGERHRRDLGDIASLAANVAQLGLLHPIVIRPDGTLLAGERRLLAAKQLGGCEIPVHVMQVAHKFDRPGRGQGREGDRHGTAHPRKGRGHRRRR